MNKKTDHLSASWTNIFTVLFFDGFSVKQRSAAPLAYGCGKLLMQNINLLSLGPTGFVGELSNVIPNLIINILRLKTSVHMNHWLTQRLSEHVPILLSKLMAQSSMTSYTEAKSPACSPMKHTVGLGHKVGLTRSFAVIVRNTNFKLLTFTGAALISMLHSVHPKC